MSAEAEKVAVGPENKWKCLQEPEHFSASKKRPKVARLLTKQEGKGESYLGGSAMSKENNAAVIHDVHKKKMENGQKPPDGSFSNSAPPELMDVAGDSVQSNSLDFLYGDFNSFSNDGLIYKPDGDAPVGGAKNYSFSESDQKVTAMSSMEIVPTTSQISPAMARMINDNIKNQLTKEVRMFGRKFQRIFDLIENVQGPEDVKKQFVEFTIKEAGSPSSRFKRVVLIQQLEKKLKKIDCYHPFSKVNHTLKTDNCVIAKTKEKQGQSLYAVE
ncbi:PREDICTED: LOW QUALITY PROTEIN: protein DDX26B-like [Galeopterus variegatus]|uniref:LOW QUALITY PROTEIN: protein DDX26B-like n=1 Tax=Galeopterus variegatus TaxID=482537 RepID=A0ABM0R9Y1_GALVR|nr:PREDICTED: LOW QUALITY PROTEIN: protein DDX26B-like [Galeopterus variegatus]